MALWEVACAAGGGEGGDGHVADCKDALLLACLHSLCSSCMAPSTGAEGTVVCRICKHSTLAGDVLQDVVSQRSWLAQQVRRERLDCELCEEEKAFFYCPNCRAGFCAVCSKRLHRLPTMTQHAVSPLSSLDVASLRDLNCAEHPDEPLKLVCKTCDFRAVCGVCAVSLHRDHVMEDLRRAATSTRSTVAQTLDPCTPASLRASAQATLDQVPFLRAAPLV